MPYPNEHACRLEDPKGFIRFRRDNSKSPHRIYGFKKKGSSVQAYRYPKKDWPAGKARKHCSEQGGKFEAASDASKETRAGLVRLHRHLHEEWLRDECPVTAEAHSIIVDEMRERGVLHIHEDFLDAMTIEETIVKRGKKFVILSKKGKVLGEEDSWPQAMKRLRQIEFFKRGGKAKDKTKDKAKGKG